MPMNDPRSRLIVALDVPDRAAALKAVNQVSGHVGYFKIGLELFTREGPRLVEEIKDRGEKIFLDLKLHDIPNTVKGAVRSACRLGIDMLTVHASGGENMLSLASQESTASLWNRRNTPSPRFSIAGSQETSSANGARCTPMSSSP